ncbi:MAG TPA: RNA-binding S4 domain-containing protein [Flavipsychrobacter sp.]|jgi:ribosome-associated heat shock protein Hsp15|nr:RNA-binding S4 domain-containing protein [Flavipsychrobacter sp.]
MEFINGGKGSKQIFFIFEKMQQEKLRLDKYLWAIRVFKTRTLATAAIEDGNVKYNGSNLKPSKAVAIGDKYEIKTPFRKWLIEVTGLLQNRVGYDEAIRNYIDHTPEEDKVIERMSESFYTGKRLSKTGKPTKKQRRDRTDFFEEDL